MPVLASPAVVLDTNVVFDWLLFRNAELAGLAAAIAGGAVRWVATAAMRDEFEQVLARGRLDAWAPDVAALRSAWDRHCASASESPTAASASARFRCADPDDQMFIDLALAAPARWLISRDRAVLALARRLRAAGVEVTTPQCWTPPR